MKVNIIARPWANEERILPRLGRLLSERTGWPVRSTPERGCEVAYYFPYLEMPPARRPACLTAAWFTHRDTSLAGKAEEWGRVASAVDLRLVSAGMYLPGLERWGPARLVTPPLDREKFTIAEREPHAKPVIGTSGYSYPGGRKGEELLSQLRAHLGKAVQVVASGRGWPAPTRLYPWERMQEFYQGLDLYVCTSSIEGVGYGPLEALACGIPVVVPAGVGVFDDLPDIPGIERYLAGSAPALLLACERALVGLGEVDRDGLRMAVERYSVDAWVADHVAAFEEMLGGAAAWKAQVAAGMESAAELPPLPGWRGRSGVYVVAFGEPARRCAVRCIESVRRHMPEVPVALCSDSPLGPETLFLQEREADVGARSQKIRIYELAPAAWQYVLYLDADTELMEPADALFDALADGWEACWTHNPPQDGLLRHALRPDNREEYDQAVELLGTENVQQLNGGVFSFRRCERTGAFFERWGREWQRWGKRDQLALLRTLHAMPLRIWLLGRDFNAVGHYGEHRPGNAIRHYPMQARRWRGVIQGRSDSPEAWGKVGEWEREQVAGVPVRR